MATELTTIASGLGFVEGPRWHEGRLWFSDFSSRTVRSVDESGEVRQHAYVAGQPSGLGFTPDGDLLVVSTHEGHILRIDSAGTTLVVDIGAHYRGALNDMLVDKRGRAYVTAFPAHVAGQRTGQVHGPPSVPLFLVCPKGCAQVAAEDLAVPNGMALSHDGRTLIVAETLGRRLTAFDVAADGTLSGRRIFADLGDRKPDGICMDSSGAVWFGSPFTSEFVLVQEGGDVLEIVATPGRWAVSCALGGADGKTLWCATVAVTLDEYRLGGGHGAIEICRPEDELAVSTARKGS
jgi:sugar lactone lactonase YvrE